MNVLPYETQRTIIHLLVEGNSIRSIERLTGVHRDTIMRLMVKVGDKCREFLDRKLCCLKLAHVEYDEIWTFVLCKQAHLPAVDAPLSDEIGDQFLFVGIDKDTKLIASFAIGKRTAENGRRFALDLASRIVTDHPQLSTDGWNAYPGAMREAFGEEALYGQIIKDFEEPVQPGRYGPPVMVAADRRQVLGLVDIDPYTICTSHVERNNLTIRTFMRRFTRLSLGFSKKLENLAAAVALHVAHYNFCRVHSSLRMTPAMAAGIADHIWELDDLLVALD